MKLFRLAILAVLLTACSDDADQIGQIAEPLIYPGPGQCKVIWKTQVPAGMTFPYVVHNDGGPGPNRDGTQPYFELAATAPPYLMIDGDYEFGMSVKLAESVPGKGVSVLIGVDSMMVGDPGSTFVPDMFNTIGDRPTTNLKPGNYGFDYHAPGYLGVRPTVYFFLFNGTATFNAPPGIISVQPCRK